MDFIERTLGIAPDLGSGGLELLLLAVPCALLALTWRRRARATDASPRDRAPRDR